MTGILLKIKEISNDLNPTEKRIAEYILNNAEEVIHLSISVLAERSGTSQAAVVRFCKSIQYKGFKELKIDISSDIVVAQKEDEDKYTDIRAGDKLESIIENVCHNNKKSIEDTLSVLDYEQIKKAVNALHKAKRIDFYGVGASGIIALDAQQKFMRINKFSLAYTDPHLQVTAAANLKNGDVAVLLSYSGETNDIIETMRVAKMSGATVISITKYGKHTIGEGADIRLCLSSPETSMRSGAMGSRIAQLNVIDILFSAVASIEYSSIKAFLDKTSKVTSLKRNNR
jgi:DNA-binding MurR/RpiR family transcriptional regulator